VQTADRYPLSAALQPLARRADVAAGTAGLELDDGRATRRARLPLPVADEQKALVPAPLFAVQVELPRAAAVINALLQRLPKRPPQRGHPVQRNCPDLDGKGGSTLWREGPKF